MSKSPYGINLKNIVDDFQKLANKHKQLNSFGFGDVDEFTYQVDSRDKTANPNFQAPYYPYFYVVPSNITHEFNFMIYEFQLIVSDIVQRDMDNMTDILSDTLQIMSDIISMFRLSYTQENGDYNEFYFVDDPVEMIPFIERYDDLLCGYSATLRIKTRVSLDRCVAAFNEFDAETPCVSPTPTGTPDVTPTPTPTPTCPVTTQYLEVELSDNTKFKLILWNDSGFSSPASANCDYLISGCAYGDLGTVYCGEETITIGQHQHQFDLAPVLLPGEIVASFDVASYTLDGCPCPVNLILPV